VALGLAGHKSPEYGAPCTPCGRCARRLRTHHGRRGLSTGSGAAWKLGRRAFPKRAVSGLPGARAAMWSILSCRTPSYLQRSTRLTHLRAISLSGVGNLRPTESPGRCFALNVLWLSTRATLCDGARTRRWDTRFEPKSVASGHGQALAIPFKSMHRDGLLRTVPREYPFVCRWGHNPAQVRVSDCRQ